MLRWMLPLAAVVFTLDLAPAADMTDGGARVYVYGKAPRHGQILPVQQDSDLLFTP